MREDTRGFLDGERPHSDLAPAAREEAEAWERLVAVLREDVPGLAPAWLEGAVMADVRAARGVALRRATSWLLRPSLRLSPLAAGLAAAAVAVLMLAPWREPVSAPSGSLGATDAAASSPVVYVQFVLEAPGARSVAVAGDFNNWDGRHDLVDYDEDGVWMGRVPMRPGVHQYMFVLDGSDWVTDPRAERWTDDGFGNRNAVVAVAPPSTT